MKQKQMFLGGILLFFYDTAAVATNSLQLCPTLCDPIDGSPPGSPVPGIHQTRTLEWVAICFSIAWNWKVKVKSLSCVRLFATPWTAAHQAPPSVGFSRQEYWSGVPSPSPYNTAGVGDLIFSSPVFSKSSLNIWKFSVHVLLKPSLKDFKHNLASVWSECNYTVIWTFCDIAFLWVWYQNWPFLVLWPLLSFPNLLAYWVQHI